MSSRRHRDAFNLAEEIADELVLEGARAVVVMGSFARGDAGPHSDLDLVAIGDGPDYRLEQHDGQLVAISWLSLDEIEASLARPEKVGYAVPGWRDARIIQDEHGVAASFQLNAREWDWSDLDEQTTDSYVAHELCGLAEEVHKLVGLLVSGGRTGAAVQRNILAFRLGAIFAVHLHLLYSSENELWDLVCDQIDEEWAVVQARAFGLGDENFRMTCCGALELYRLTVEYVDRVFDSRERAVVEHAVAKITSFVAGNLR